MDHDQIVADLVADVSALTFALPVSHVYNPLVYARKPYVDYLKRYGKSPKEIVLLGMNPGPWGMAQTGIPFGEITAVTKWLGIRETVERPTTEHPKRPVLGFDCARSEVSGKRLWGWAEKIFKTPDRFFDRFFVANYCPLVFMAESGKNRTPNHLPVSEKKPLLAACDRALRKTVSLLNPRYVVGIGAFAADRAEVALSDMDVTVGKILHPSPANPKANRDWEGVVTEQFKAMGIAFEPEIG
ncbi:MAG: single-stranded DNA-binding protein [Deltaproteobacteria bacterium]|nr:single-stranded DNA-binding protein [Deltaproteobacteria bacterium]